MCMRFAALFSLLACLASREVDALIEYYAVCGASFEDAETNCMSRTLCPTGLGCPAGEACFAVPLSEDCQPPVIKTNSYTPNVSISDIKSFCGPEGVPGAWDLASLTCSPLTMCPTGSCPLNQVCYGGIACEIETQSTTTTAGTAPVSTTGVSQTTTTTTVEPGPEVKNYCGPEASEGNAWATAQDNCSPATECDNGTCPDGQTCYGGIICEEGESQPVPNNAGDYCGPDPSRPDAWMQAFMGCSPETECINGSCPDGGTCFGGIDCSSKPTTTTTTSGPTTTSFTTTSGTTTTDNTKSYCGPDPSEANDAWMQAFMGCSPETECDGTCPDGGMCFAGIDCSAKPTTTTTTSGPTTTSFTTTSGTTTTDNTKSYCGPDPSEANDAWMQAFMGCSPETECDGTCPDGGMCFAGIDCSTKPTTTTTTSGPTTTSFTTTSGTTTTDNSKSYCGPNPSEANDAWMQAFMGCSPETECPDGTCPDGGMCFAGIVCEDKPTTAPPTTTSKPATTEMETTTTTVAPTTTTTTTTEMTTSTTTTTTTTTTVAPTTTEAGEPDTVNASLKNFCGPNPDFVVDALDQAIEYCSPQTECPDLECPFDQVCFTEIFCESMQTTAATTPVATTTTFTTDKFCGPDPSEDNNAWMKAYLGCKPETACPDDKCPNGGMCFPGIDCASKPTTTTTPTQGTTTTTTTVNQMFCGPDPAKNHNAWMEAYNGCSHKTACPDGVCKDGQTCFAGIECPNIDNEDSDSMESSTTTQSATVNNGIEENVSVGNKTPETAETDAPSNEADTTTTEAATTKPATTDAATTDAATTKPATTEATTTMAETTSSSTSTASDTESVDNTPQPPGICGVYYQDSKDNCATSKPCTYDSECDDFMPGVWTACYVVPCSEKNTYVPPPPEEGVVTKSGMYCGGWYDEAVQKCSPERACSSNDDCREKCDSCASWDICYNGVTCTYSTSSAFSDSVTGSGKSGYAGESDAPFNSGLRPRTGDMENSAYALHSAMRMVSRLSILLLGVLCY